MAVVNMNVKDSRWLQIEVCREFQRNLCSRPDTECKFAHPSPNVELLNGRVIACYDSIKDRCTREKPPCKYFHPPPHLKDQLLINGRNHLALKHALLQQIPLQTVLATTGQLPLVGAANGANLLSVYTRPSPTVVHQIANQQRAALAAASFFNGTIYNNSTSCKAPSTPYVTNLPIASASAYGTYPPAIIPGFMSTADHLTSSYGIIPAHTALVTTRKTNRTDRIEICREYQRGNCKRPETECRFAHPPKHVQVDDNDGEITVCMDFMKGRCSREQCRYFHPPSHLQAHLKANQNRAQTTPLTIPGVVPITKRPALEKSGIPVYQPGASVYQQALAIHQSFVPFAFTGHPGIPRY